MILSQSRLWFAALGAAAILGTAATARAQDTDATRKKFTLNVPEVANTISSGTFFRGAPGTNSGTPLAFGPNWRDAFVGGGYQNQTRGFKQPNGTISANNTNDGSVSAGFGLGDNREAVGVEVAITSLSTFRSGFGNRTAFSFKVHRMLGNTAAVAVGVENAFIAGGQKTDGTDSWYGVVSKVFVLPGTESGFFKAFTMSGGIGNGRFRFLDDVVKNKQTVNVFGSASMLLHNKVSAIVDYTGHDLNLGLSLVPFHGFPMVITPTLADVTGTASKTPRFELGVGIGMHF